MPKTHSPTASSERSISRRTFLSSGSALLLSLISPLPSLAAQIVAVRVWPAEDYTRVTLESDTPLKVDHFLLKNPERMVVDIGGLDLNPMLKELVAKIQANDPYIQQVRVGQNNPQVVRLVFDLKEEIRPQVFTLDPVAGYRNRLVFDLYPSNPPDLIEQISRGKNVGKESAQVAQNGAGNQSAKPNSGQVPDGLNGKSSQAPEMSRLITIALDPGHGGEDPGAIGAAGSREKDVVLAIARRVKAKLEKQDNVRVMMTRDGDYFVPLHVRVQKARKVRADLMISIHADAWIEPTARGSSVFMLSEKGASSTAARWLAKNQNASDLIGGTNIKTKDKQLASILLDLSTTAQIKDSMKLAKSVLGEIGQINKLHKGVVEQAGFAVLRAPDIPSILIETAFISNPHEEKKLTDEDYQDRLAEAITNGINQYFAKNPALSRRKMT